MWRKSSLNNENRGKLATIVFKSRLKSVTILDLFLTHVLQYNALELKVLTCNSPIHFVSLHMRLLATIQRKLHHEWHMYLCHEEGIAPYECWKSFGFALVFAFTLDDWFKTRAPLSQPLKSYNKTYLDLFADVSYQTHWTFALCHIRWPQRPVKQNWKHAIFCRILPFCALFVSSFDWLGSIVWVCCYGPLLWFCRFDNIQWKTV